MTSSLTEAASLFDEFLSKNTEVEFLRVYWLDFAARLRLKIVTKRFARELANTPGSHLTAGSNCLNKLVDTSSSAGGLKCGTDDIYLDWTTLRPCPHVPGHASVLTNIRHVGDNFESCPRTTLSRVITQLKELSITTFVGIEIELAMFEGPADAPQPLDIATGWLDSAVFRSKYLSVLENMVIALQASSIPVREMHAESGAQGTFEIVLDHGDPLQAVDDYVRAQDIIKTVGYHQGLHVTMAPRPFAWDDPFDENRTTTQGAHAHISIQPVIHEDHFMAGILNAVPLLCAFGMASIDSYFRSHESVEEGAGHWVGWGFQNRYLPVRKINPGHWEIRYMDATANMYMVMATTLAAGLHGIKTRRSLTWKDCQLVPSTMTKTQLADHCMTSKMPRSLEEALEALRKEKWLGQYMAPIIVQAHENVKDKELKVVGEWTAEERRRFYNRVF